jgi:hypothetical protein
MLNFVDITKPEDLQPYNDAAKWKVVADKNTYPGKFINEQGEVVSSHHKGKIYHLVGKIERERGFFERMGRIALGLILTVGLLFLPLFFERVRNLFSAKEIVVARELARDARDPNAQVLGMDVANIVAFDIVARNDGKYTCTPFEQLGLLQNGYGYILDETELKDILDLLPSALPGQGDRDAIAKLNYIRV